MERRAKKRIVFAAVALLLLYPFQTRVVPAWKLRVVDDIGQPVPHAVVKYSWVHSSIEWNDSEEDTYADENGYVSFPERSTRASIIQRVLRAVTNVPWVVHVDWGPHGFIMAYGKPGYDTGGAWYNGEEPPPQQIVLEPMKPLPPEGDHNYFPYPP